MEREASFGNQAVEASHLYSIDTAPHNDNSALSVASSEHDANETTASRPHISAAQHAKQQGHYKATLAKLEGSVASSERRLRSQASEIDKLRDRCSQLERELQSTRTMLDATPERCKTTQRTLKDEARRAKKTAGINEFEVARLQELVVAEAQQLSELQEFAEVERGTLLEKVGELEGALGEALAAERQAALQRDTALARLQQLELDELEAQQQVAELSTERDQLAGTTGSQAQQLQQLQQLVAELRQERDQAAEGGRRARADLDSVVSSSNKMIKQVRGITFALEKHGAALHRLPEVPLLLRNLKDWVVGSQKAWEGLGENEDYSVRCAAGGLQGGSALDAPK